MGADILYRCPVCGSEDIEYSEYPKGKDDWYCHTCSTAFDTPIKEIVDYDRDT